jgi:hypothetical protein
LLSCFDDAPERVQGGHGYSYDRALEVFLPLLKELRTVIPIARPESQLEYAIERARLCGSSPVALSFLPLQNVFFTRSAPAVVYLFWEFPDLPTRELNDNPRFDWARLAKDVSLLLTSCTYTAAAFERAGIRIPMRVVPVPIRQEYLGIPPWQLSFRTKLECRGLTLSARLPEASPRASFTRALLQAGKVWYRRRARHWLPGIFKRCIRSVARGVRAMRGVPLTPLDFEPLELSGVQYTAIICPLDPRKDWQTMIKAFVFGLRECADATLFLKLVLAPSLTDAGIREVEAFCRSLGVPRHCRIVLSADWFDSKQMLELTRTTTFYVNPSRAEGACLPLQEMLAAGRPALSPVHSAMADYFSADAGFVIASHPEPTCWPGDLKGRLTTQWSTLVWESFAEQFRASYVLAKDPAAYAAMSIRARERALAWAAPTRVRALLADALALLDAPCVATRAA